MPLDANDALSKPIPFTAQAIASVAGVSARTARRWIAGGHIMPLPNLPTAMTTPRAVLECHRLRVLISRQGRPGARLPNTDGIFPDQNQTPS